MSYGVLVRFCIAVINTESKSKSQNSQAHALTGGSQVTSLEAGALADSMNQQNALQINL